VISLRVRESAGISAWLAWVAAVVISGCVAQESDVGGAPVRLAPDFTLQDVHGTEFSLADFRGKTVVIDFWATWCVPCLYQIPALNEYWARYREGEEVVVIGVAIDVEGAEIVAPWIAEQGVEYLILIGEESLAREYGAMGFPTIAVVNPDGEIVAMHAGIIDVDELEDLISQTKS
jgi:thiol-disulfide isomerase/thioredoxin